MGIKLTKRIDPVPSGSTRRRVRRLHNRLTVVPKYSSLLWPMARRSTLGSQNAARIARLRSERSLTAYLCSELIRGMVINTLVRCQCWVDRSLESRFQGALGRFDRRWFAHPRLGLHRQSFDRRCERRNCHGARRNELDGDRWRLRLDCVFGRWELVQLEAPGAHSFVASSGDLDQSRVRDSKGVAQTPRLPTRNTVFLTFFSNSLFVSLPRLSRIHPFVSAIVSFPFLESCFDLAKQPHGQLNGCIAFSSQSAELSSSL